MSIIMSILASSSLPTDLSESTHGLALEYLSVYLSIRDRREIIRVMCYNSPDHVTTIVRTMVSVRMIEFPKILQPFAPLDFWKGWSQAVYSQNFPDGFFESIYFYDILDYEAADSP